MPALRRNALFRGRAVRSVRLAGCLAVSLALLGGAAALTGCSAMIADSPFFRGNDVNLLEINYAAADMMAHSARGMMKPGTPVHVGALTDAYPDQVTVPPGQPKTFFGMPVPLTHTSETEEGAAVSSTPVPASPPVPSTVIRSGSAPFGKVVAEQIAGRWVDLGFNVIGGPGAPKPGQVILGGQYARANGRVLINLRLRDASSGRVLAAYDYTLPISSEIDDLLGTKERNASFFRY